MSSTHLRSDIRERGAERTASFSNFVGKRTVMTTASINTASVGTLNSVRIVNTASVLVGDKASGNYVRLGEQVGIRLFGETKTWEDLRFPPSRVIKNPSDSKPDYINLVGNITVLGFDAAASEWVTGVAQMPHSWRQGSSIRPHVHWSPTKASNAASRVAWTLYYWWVNANDRWITASRLSVTGSQTTGGVASTSRFCALGTIAATGKTLSSMFTFRLVRNVSRATDDFNADAAMVEFDIHYQINSFGSDEELSKS